MKESSSAFDLDKSLTGAVESGAVDQLLNRLEKASQHPENIQDLTNLMIEVDQTAPIRHFRATWDKLPGVAKWAIVHTPGLLPEGQGPLDLMLNCGFIVYDSKEDLNSAANQREIKQMGSLKRFLLKQGVNIGALFIPELRAVKPFIGPMLHLEAIKADLVNKIRPALVQARQTREAPGRNIATLTADEHQKLMSVLPANPKSPKLNVVSMAEWKAKNRPK